MPRPGSHKIANQCVVEYWRKHLRIITNPFFIWLLTPFWEDRVLSYDVTDYQHAPNIVNRYVTIQKEWGNRPPILSLTENDRERGWDLLKTLGVSDDAWFVCLHARESGFKPNPYADRYRNVDINSYIPTMKAIVEHGGWCVRMGDPTMKPIPQIERVVDYVHLSIRSDWMDVFLSASCRFFLGCESGLNFIPEIFGVPNATSNRCPMSNVLQYGNKDISIPKLVWSLKEERYLMFKEVLDSPIGHFPPIHSFSEAGVQVIDNSPEEIRALALEMLAQTEGTLKYTNEDEVLQNRFKSLMNPTHFSYGALSRVGRDFLRKYEYLL